MSSKMKGAPPWELIPSVWNVANHTWKYERAMLEKFANGLLERKFTGIKCPSCGRIYMPPKAICGRCHELTMTENPEWVEVSDYGTVISFSAGYSRKAREDKEVKGIPIVTVNHDGTDTSYIAMLKPGIELEDVHVGMRVKVVWADEPVYTKQPWSPEPVASIGNIRYYEPVTDE
jgi:uncharacterized OB-fold protein